MLEEQDIGNAVFWASIEGYALFHAWADETGLSKVERQMVAMYIQRQEIK